MIVQKTKSKYDIFTIFQSLKTHHKCGGHAVIFLLTILLLSVLTAVNFKTDQRLYAAGDIAQSQVIADREIFVEDAKSTQERIDKSVMLMPKIYDLTIQPYLKFQETLILLLKSLNADPENRTPDEKAAIEHFKDLVTPSLAEELLPELAKPEVQQVLLKQIFPFILQKMGQGMVSDIRSVTAGPSGVLIRDLDAKRDILRTEMKSIPDVQTLLAEVAVKLRQDRTLNPISKREINVLFATIVPPASLTLNQEATKRREEEIRSSIEPVYFHVQKGETIVQKGEKINRDQEIKLKAFYRSTVEPISWAKAFGVFISAMVISIGLFISPSGKPGTPLHGKDLLLISSLLLVFSLGALCCYLFSLHLESRSLGILIALYPVPACVGITSMIFAARRYCTMGLLTAFFSTLLLHAPWQIFLAYFLCSMLFTWLVVSAYTRQDAVWSIIPFTLGQLLIWTGMFFLSQFPMEVFPVSMLACAISSFLSLFLLFALCPILEMIFGYSTRFRLMELMSLEQPLMQELMVRAPGTYHHSLIVGNMVEAGAKAIGANSLLCKVAALYHDIGKLQYPEYFIENQFGGPNRHDKLAPSMSALVLLSHVKRGVEMAREYKLGKEICDIIQEHHGKRIMQFFYQKAIKLGETPDESDYRYTGPLPQTRESAIIMLADSVEASSRTLTDPTPARVKSHIDKIVKGIFAEGQLDESELTFKDLHHLSENFERILTGIFHQRIAYPEQKTNPDKQAAQPPTK